VWGHDEEVNLLHLGLRSLLEKVIVYDVNVRMEHEEKENGDALVKNKHRHDFPL